LAGGDPFAVFHCALYLVITGAIDGRFESNWQWQKVGGFYLRFQIELVSNQQTMEINNARRSLVLIRELF